MKFFMAIVAFMMPMTSFASMVGNDTAKNVVYMTKGEKEVVRILNEARTDPPTFAKKYLKGNSIAEAKECYMQMLSMKPLHPLLPSEQLTMSAIAHAIDMGRTGKVGHIGTNGSNLKTRVEDQCTWGGMISENCSYGHKNPLDIVLQLLIDRGVTDRGHRKNIFSKDAKYVGVSIQPHKKYIYNCVMDFAGAVKIKPYSP